MSETTPKPNKAVKKAKEVKKVTQAQLIQRVSEVLELLAGGHTRSHIVRYAAKKWGIGSRQTESYMSMATKELLESNQTHVDQVASQIKRKLWEIVRTAPKESDKVSALKELARISGIGSTNVNITVEDKDELAHLTDEELRAFYGSYKT